MIKGYNHNSLLPKLLPRWIKPAIKILLLVLIICIVYAIFLYYNIQKDQKVGLAATGEMVLSDTELITIHNIEQYDGAESYHIVLGETKDEESKIVFVPLKKNKQDKKKDPMIIDQTEIISKEAIEKQWEKQCNKCKLIKITHGIENNDPLWEITYIDDSNRYVLDYLSIYDGSQYEQFRFTQMFK